MTALDLQTLASAVAGSAAAIRSVASLEPAGGPSDKVFPPTYVKERNAETKYAFETRRIDGHDVPTVLLDSVASQANRFEESLLEGWRRKELAFPVVQVDFSKQEGLEDLEQITSLQAPHRIADALLRDSVLDGTPFRLTTAGTAITDARPTHATAMYKYCPTALVFGVWDSTGPKGGSGAKFQRCLVSEIVGLHAKAGVKTGSRLDPTGIQTKAGPVYKHKDPAQDWTVDPTQAETKGGKPVEFSRSGGDGKKGSPSAINHGNIPPSIETDSGGVTISEAVQTTVLSLAGLRRLRFQQSCAWRADPGRKTRCRRVGGAYGPRGAGSRGRRLPARERLRPPLSLPPRREEALRARGCRTGWWRASALHADEIRSGRAAQTSGGARADVRTRLGFGTNHPDTGAQARCAHSQEP